MSLGRLLLSPASPSSSLVHASSSEVLSPSRPHCSFCWTIIYVLDHIHANHCWYLVTNFLLYKKNTYFFVTLLDIYFNLVPAPNLHSFVGLNTVLYLLLADMTCPSAASCAKPQRCGWYPYTLVSWWAAPCQPSTHPVLWPSPHSLIVMWLCDTFSMFNHSQVTISSLYINDSNELNVLIDLVISKFLVVHSS